MYIDILHSRPISKSTLELVHRKIEDICITVLSIPLAAQLTVSDYLCVCARAKHEYALSSG